MRKSLVILLAGFACIMMIAAGCTSTSGTAPATTAATTPAATTAAAMPSAPVAEATTAAVANTTAATPLSWSGSWNTSYTSPGNATVIEVLVINQAGSSVTGTYGRNSTGTINATVQESKLAGTWSESDAAGNYTGTFEFVRSADDKSFTGRWIDASEKSGALSNTTQTWNGVRI
jgi:hypothetical protein